MQQGVYSSIMQLRWFSKVLELNNSGESYDRHVANSDCVITLSYNVINVKIVIGCNFDDDNDMDKENTN